MLLLPRYADVVAEARRNGQRPEHVVFVAIDPMPTLHRAYPVNWTVTCAPRIPVSRFDFSWAIGLDVELVAERIFGNERAVDAVQRIDACRPRNLVAWEASTGRRWWIRDVLGDWPKPYRIETDRCLTPARMARAA